MDHDQTTMKSPALDCWFRVPGRLLTLFPCLTLFPTLAISAQLTFRHALELARDQAEIRQRPEIYDDCLQRRGPSIEEIAVSLTVNDRGAGIQSNVEGAIGAANSLAKESTDFVQSSLSSQDSRGIAVLCTAIAYIELVKVYSQAQILDRQEMASTRLLKVEAQRVREKVDNPGAFTRAKLLAARTHLWAVELESEAKRTQQQLAYFTGLDEGHIEPISGSILQLPSVGSSMAERRFAALRDVAQLEQAVSLDDRNKSRVRNVLATATLGDMISSYVVDDEKLNVVLEINFALQKVQLQMLQTRDDLQRWILSGSETSSSTSSIGRSTLLPTSEMAASNSPSVQSIMIVPGESDLKVGHSRQFYAIAIYSNGTSRDVSAEAVWTSSNSWDAIISSSGFVTAVGPDDISITVSFGGSSQSERIRIIPDDPEPFSRSVELCDCRFDSNPP